MSITELIEQLKAMPEKMEGFNSEGEIVVLNTHKLAESLKKSLRNCDVGTSNEQYKRFDKICSARHLLNDCPLFNKKEPCCSPSCFARWSQMPYEEKESEVK